MKTKFYTLLGLLLFFIASEVCAWSTIQFIFDKNKIRGQSRTNPAVFTFTLRGPNNDPATYKKAPSYITREFTINIDEKGQLFNPVPGTNTSMRDIDISAITNNIISIKDDNTSDRLIVWHSNLNPKVSPMGISNNLTTPQIKITRDLSTANNPVQISQ